MFHFKATENEELMCYLPTGVVSSDFTEAADNEPIVASPAAVTKKCRTTQLRFGRYATIRFLADNNYNE